MKRQLKATVWSRFTCSALRQRAVFEPFEVDLVFAQEHDPLFQYEIVKGIRIYHAQEATRGCDYEEAVMRMAEDLS